MASVAMQVDHRGSRCARVGWLSGLLVISGSCGEGCDRGPWAKGRAVSSPTSSSTVASSAAAAVAKTAVGPSASPAPSPAAPLDLEVVNGRPTSLGTTAFTVNARVHPHGAPAKVWVEYGPTPSYGRSTPTRPLPPRLAAYFRESWDRGTSGFSGGIVTKDLSHRPSGGVAGGHVRYRDMQGGSDDTNHIDGIGIVHLTKYFYLGTATEPGMPSVALGGGDPDLRDARITVHVRGVKWKPGGTELVWWMQCDRDLAAQNDTTWRRANWALTGSRLTDALASGRWERMEYRLVNDTNHWTYAGNSVGQNRPNYVYWSLDQALAHVNNDAFHMLVYVDQGNEPSGSIDYDELEIAYRNHNVLLPTNGGKLAAAPESPDDVSALTDGWRRGDGRAWRGPSEPKAPFEVSYALEAPIEVQRVQVHPHPELPAKDVEVLGSRDGASWETLAAGELPPSSFLLRHLVKGTHPPVRFVKVRVKSGRQAKHWGLGEIEVFGEGARMRTDDDWYHVNADIEGLGAGVTVHYRVVVESDAGRVAGPPAAFTVPTGVTPEVVTGGLVRTGPGIADVEGRLNTFGEDTEWRFEYGPDLSYGSETDPKRGGVQITPRSVVASLSGLRAGQAVHYRLVAKNAAGESRGEDRTFTAR